VNVLAFDIETVPDVATGREAYGLGGLSDEEVAKALGQLRVQEYGNDFLRLHMHRIVAISVVLNTGSQIRVWSLGGEGSEEAELITRFFEGLERYAPVLVSWNGGGFDLPVLHYRSLFHGVQAPLYWGNGEHDRDWRFNNYRNRFHERHTDLMDVLSMYQPRATVPLEALCLALGLPGKMGMHGREVWDRYREGDLRGIRAYCETDALNTYLVFLRFELVRGHLTRARFGEECRKVRQRVAGLDAPHWRQFLDQWRTGDEWCELNGEAAAFDAEGPDGEEAASDSR